MTAVLLINAIGDHYLAVPTLRALHQLFGPDLRIVGVKGIAHRVFGAEGFPEVCEVHATWNRRLGWHFDEAALLDLVKNCDTLISLCPWKRESLVRLFETARAERTVGFGTEFDYQLSVVPGVHAFDEAFSAVTALAPGARLDNFAYPLRLTPEGERIRAAISSASGGVSRLLAVHTEGKPERRWGSAGWAGFLERVHSSNSRIAVCLLDVNPPQGELGVFVEAHPTFVCADPLPLEQAVGVLTAADWFVGINSCFLHVADLQRIPSLALFRTTTPSEFGFRLAPRYRHVLLDSGEVAPIWEAWQELAEG